MTRNSPPIQDVAAFVAVAENTSFTRAAEKLGSTKSNVGKAVQRLEATLGTKLLQRTTRAVRLTEDGETYFEAARAALDGLNDAEIALAARRDEPVGRVRIDAPIGLGSLIFRSLAQLRNKYPKVTLEISLKDRASDPVTEGWDIVVRVGDLLSGGDMMVRKLCDLKLKLVASPVYLAQREPIKSVQDLRLQNAIVFKGNAGRPRPWTISEAGKILDVMPRTVLLLADGRAMVDAAIAGLGIAQIFDKVADPHIANGHLVHVLSECDAPGPALHALVPLGRRMPPKTRVALDYLVEILRSQRHPEPTSRTSPTAHRR